MIKYIIDFFPDESIDHLAYKISNNREKMVILWYDMTMIPVNKILFSIKCFVYVIQFWFAISVSH